MTDTPSRRRSRLNRTEQHLYTARAQEDSIDAGPQADAMQPLYTPNEPETAYAAYTPNEPDTVYASYTPNEPGTDYAAYTPNDWPQAANDAPQVDYAAYYSREGAELEGEAEPAFAPPPSMQQYACEPQAWQEDAVEEDSDYAANNVYRPRRVTWAEEDREEAIAESELGYQVQQEDRPVRRKRHTLRNLLIILLALALLGGAAWLLREPIAEMLGVTVFVVQTTEEPFAAIVTPEPIKAYDAAPAAAVADTARNTIARLSGTVPMDNYIVTDNHIVTRSQRPDGSFDFYLFTAAEGRLLCYFEGLDALDMIPQEFGGFYVRQSPWLVAPGGSALIRTADIEAALHENVFLHPMYRGWAVVESEEDGHANYVNASGQLMSSLWFSRTFPFTGEYTLAYVDTGSTAEVSDRYLLYVISEDGNMSRWLTAGDMEDVVAAACGMAYMSDGALYHLPDTSAPVCQSPEVTVYLDCDAMVIKDPVSGKYGLFVHGEQHYDFAYDAIRPLESELVWAEKTIRSGSAALTIRALTGASYPQPLSHSFVLEKDGQTEYVALSTLSSYPIRLDGEF